MPRRLRGIAARQEFGRLPWLAALFLRAFFLRDFFAMPCILTIPYAGPARRRRPSRSVLAECDGTLAQTTVGEGDITQEDNLVAVIAQPRPARRAALASGCPREPLLRDS